MTPFSPPRQLRALEIELKVDAVDQPADQPPRVGPVAAKRRDGSHDVPNPYSRGEQVICTRTPWCMLPAHLSRHCPTRKITCSYAL